MKRRVYVICQNKNWGTGRTQVISDGAGKLAYVYASPEGLKEARRIAMLMNKDNSMTPVHVRKATLIIEEEIKDVKLGDNK